MPDQETALEHPRRVTRLDVLVLDTVIVLAGVGAYFGIRGQTVTNVPTALDHARDILALERGLGLDLERGLQASVSQIPALTTVMNWIYVWGHWPVITLVLLWLARRHRPVFRRFRDAMLVSGAMGLCVYTTYPVAPPRLSGLGMIDTVAQQSRAYRALQPPGFVNQYAAMPSLHVGWDLLVGLSLIAAGGSLVLRVVGVLLPAAMALATITTANHYVLDVVVGLAFGLVGWAVASLVAHRGAPRAARLPDVLGPQPVP